MMSPQAYATWRAECCKADIEMGLTDTGDFRPRRTTEQQQAYQKSYQKRYRETHRKSRTQTAS